MFGVLPAQLTGMTTTWRREAAEIGKLMWSGLSEATGEGSAVLAAVRGSADPAQQATASIETRFDAVADLIDKFSTAIQDLDAEIGSSIDQLSPR